MKLEPKNEILEAVFKRSKHNLIIFRHGHIAINNYHMGDNREFEKSLSVWNKQYYKYELKGGFYVPEMGEFRIARGYPHNSLKYYFPNRKAVIENKAYKHDDHIMKLTTPPNTDFQNVTLTHMLSKGPYENLARYTQQIIDAPTGEGKTFCSVAASVFLAAKAIIFVPFQKLVDQWRDSYINFTSLDDNDILYVQGSKMCEKIRKGEYLDKKVFIFVIDTVSSYNKKYGNIKTMEMLSMTRAYVKFVDEAHRKLGAINMLEAMSNFRMNYYMTATFGRAEQKEDAIIKKLFKDIPQFGSTFKNEEERHLNIIVKKYKFFPTNLQISQMYRRNVGLNTKSYEKVLMTAPVDQKRDFDNSLKTMLTWSLGKIRPENKILILCSTIDGIEYVKNILLGITDLTEIGVYHSKIGKADKVRQLEKRIIISTDGSLGTGADIKGLEHVHNIITYSNAISAKQLPGRGRSIEGVKIVYIEYVNVGYIKTADQYMRRKPALLKNTPTGQIQEIG